MQSGRVGRETRRCRSGLVAGCRRPRTQTYDIFSDVRSYPLRHEHSSLASSAPHNARRFTADDARRLQSDGRRCSAAERRIAVDLGLERRVQRAGWLSSRHRKMEIRCRRQRLGQSRVGILYRPPGKLFRSRRQSGDPSGEGKFHWTRPCDARLHVSANHDTRAFRSGLRAIRGAHQNSARTRTVACVLDSGK